MLTAELNADGFGFGWYLESGDPGAYTNPMPIWSDINLAHIGRAFESRLWLGNVRSATPGQPVNQGQYPPVPRRQPIIFAQWIYTRFRQRPALGVAAILGAGV